MFQRAIVAKIGPTFEKGLSGKFGDLGRPDFEEALRQHAEYVRALEACGLEVTVLEADEAYPDSTFVEDVAIVTEKCAIITNPEPPSRKGEIARMEGVLRRYFSNIERIEAPGTVEGGDVLQIGDTFYVGLSERTNEHGAAQLSRILGRYGYRVVPISVSETFHLKGLVSDLGDHYITIAGELRDHPAFAQFRKIVVDPDEGYACNVLRINDHVFVPKGHEKIKKNIVQAGFRVTELDMSEFQKQDGSLTCLSLRF